MTETKIPGLKAHHSWITDECRSTRTDAGAIDEALSRAREALESSIRGWASKTGVRFHVVVTVEPPK